MANQAQFKFVKALAKDLEAGDIQLPSLPAVVIKIRNLLDDDNSDFELISNVVSVDSALASKIFVIANSAYHNTGGEEIVSLDAAIAKLGLDVVRNTSVAMLLQQLTRARQQPTIAKSLREIWSRSMRLSSMSHSLAAQHASLNDETAFMCGLLHDVGKLYVLNKATEIPGLLAEGAAPITDVNDDWYSQIGRCIVEAWEFPAEIVESMDISEYMDEHVQRSPRMVDVVYVAGMLIDCTEEQIPDIIALPACQKLAITQEKIPAIFSAYKDKLAVVQQTLA